MKIVRLIASILVALMGIIVFWVNKDYSLALSCFILAGIFRIEDKLCD